MANKALVLGCSHALGAEMWLGPSDHDIPHPQENFGAINSYPMQIARHLGYNPSNNAISGGSNDAMFRIWMERYHQIDPSDTVIACWTGRHRSEIWGEHDEIWLQISAGTESYLKRVRDDLFEQGRTIGQVVKDQSQFVNYTKLWHVFSNDHVSALNNKLKNIIALNESARKIGVQVINFDSFDPIDSPLIAHYEWPIDVSFMSFAEKNGYNRTHWGHYFFDAHKAYAEQVKGLLRA